MCGSIVATWSKYVHKNHQLNAFFTINTSVSHMQSEKYLSTLCLPFINDNPLSLYPSCRFFMLFFSSSSTSLQHCFSVYFHLRYLIFRTNVNINFHIPSEIGVLSIVPYRVDDVRETYKCHILTSIGRYNAAHNDIIAKYNA